MEYIPDSGDIIILTIDPTLGREQRGRRPCLVISKRKINKYGGVVTICPITSKAKGYPIEVKLGNSPSIQGVVLTNHIRSFDWKHRNIQFVEKVDSKIIHEVLQKIAIAFNIDHHFPGIKNDFV